MTKPSADKRPLSPHLTVWKWHPTMLASILHRATGVFLYFCLLALCLSLTFLASGAQGFEQASGIIYSPFGLLVFFGFSLIISYHFLNGLRHLVWDSGRGFAPRIANFLSVLIIALAGLSAFAMSFYLYTLIALGAPL